MSASYSYLQILRDEIGSHMIVGSTWNNNVGIFFRWSTKLFECRFNELSVLSDDGEWGTVIITHVCVDSVSETALRIFLDEEFSGEKLANTLVVEKKYSFDDDHFCRFDHIFSNPEIFNF